MGRNVSGAAAAGAVVGGNKNLRVNQANGYANINSSPTQQWTDWNGWWSGQFGTSSLGYTISDATSYIKITTQVNVDHGDTWRSGLNKYSISTTRNSSGGPFSQLGFCASSNYISGYSTSGQIGFSQWFGRPADWIGGLQNGDTIYFKFEFMKQNSGGWSYINNQHTNTESASNGVMAKAGLTFNGEEVPASEASADWNG